MADNVPPVYNAPREPIPPGQPAPPPLAVAPRDRAPGGNKWRVFLVVMIVLVALGLVAYFGLRYFTLSAKVEADGYGSRGLNEVTLENNHSENKIALLDIQGVIASDIFDHTGRPMVSGIRDQLEVARRDDEVKAVILKVDSPGGEVLASDEIYRLIADFQKKSGKPVIASMGSLAASGGYYVSAPCQWIVANELTITGSIGVIMHSYNLRGLMDKVGVKPVVFKSGKFKDMLSPDKLDSEILPEERTMVQDMIDETFGKFKSVVNEGRTWAHQKNQKNADKGRELRADWESLADGRILSGRQAYTNGFVDELGNLRVAVERAQKIAGLKDANLVRYEHPFDLSNVLRFLGKSEVPAIKIDFGLDLPRLQAGRLYFLSSAMLH